MHRRALVEEFSRHAFYDPVEPQHLHSAACAEFDMSQGPVLELRRVSAASISELSAALVRRDDTALAELCQRALEAIEAEEVTARYADAADTRARREGARVVISMFAEELGVEREGAFDQWGEEAIFQLVRWLAVAPAEHLSLRSGARSAGEAAVKLRESDGWLGEALGASPLRGLLDGTLGRGRLPGCAWPEMTVLSLADVGELAAAIQPYAELSQAARDLASLLCDLPHDAAICVSRWGELSMPPVASRPLRRLYVKRA